jgi:3-hydroxyacyl-CoA dehydrogenase
MMETHRLPHGARPPRRRPAPLDCHRQGPFELADFIGLDTLQSIASGWRSTRVATGEIPSSSVAAVPSLDDLVAQGRLGRKSGRGFFEY